ncbi:MAG: hypothetical protein ACRDWV_07870 [Acidimicrobiales bacterium]
MGDPDQDDLASWFALRVARSELRRRLPDVQICAMALGVARTPLDGGERVVSETPWTPQRRAELAAELDCVAVIAPEDPTPEDPASDDPASEDPAPESDSPWPPAHGLGPEHEASCPSITVDPAVLCQLVAQVLDDTALDRRLAWLRLLGRHPATGSTVVVVGAGMDRPAQRQALQAAAESVGSHPGASVVLLGPRPPEVPPGVDCLSGPLSLEDIAAVIRSATVVVGGSDGVEALATSYQRRFVALDGEGSESVATRLETLLAGFEERDLPGSPAFPADGSRWATTILDAVAQTAIRATNPSRPQPSRPQPSGTRPAVPQPSGIQPSGTQPAVPQPSGPKDLEDLAHRARERQLVGHRRLLAEQGAELVEAQADRAREAAHAEAEARVAAAYRAEVEGRLAELRKGASEGYHRLEADIAELAAELAHYRRHVARIDSEQAPLLEALAGAREGRAALERELEATRATALFRYAAGPRRIYGALRRRLA